jgi:hypothetical protein
MKCPECGEPIGPTWKLCLSCGTKITAPTNPPISISDSVVKELHQTQQFDNREEGGANVGGDTSVRRGLKWYWTAGIGALFVIGITITLVITQNPKSNPQPWESFTVTSIIASPYRVIIATNTTSSNLTISALLSSNVTASGGLKVVTDNLTFQSSNENIATINSGGQITGKAAGSATINVSYTYGNITKSITVPVTVANPPR